MLAVPENHLIDPANGEPVNQNITGRDTVGNHRVPRRHHELLPKLDELDPVDRDPGGSSASSL